MNFSVTTSQVNEGLCGWVEKNKYYPLKSSATRYTEKTENLKYSFQQYIFTFSPNVFET